MQLAVARAEIVRPAHQVVAVDWNQEYRRAPAIEVQLAQNQGSRFLL